MSTETRVLLVDDDRDDFLLTDALLAEIQGEKFQLEWAGNWEGGLEQLRTQAYDACLLDFQLGEKSGIEFLRVAQAEGCTVPIILLTGQASGNLESEALAAGATDYLVKGKTDAEGLWRALRLARERKKALRAAREGDRLFRAIFDHALDAMIIFDDDARLIDANPAAVELTGWPRDVLLTKRTTDLSEAGSTPDSEERFRTFLATGYRSGEFKLRRSDGEIRVIQYAGSANIHARRHLSILRDVTRQRQEEETLARLAMIVESTDDIVVGIGLDDRITSWNASAERILGFPRDEVVGQPYSRIVPPELQAEYAEILARLQRGEPVRNHETARLDRDGRRVDVALTLSVNRDRAGVVIGRSSIARDIREYKSLRTRLAISDRMASVGTLAAGVAHEINNPLAVTLSNLNFCLEMLTKSGATPDIDELKEVLSEAMEGGDRVKNTVRDLKLFSRADEEKLEPVEVSRIIDSSLRMARNEIKHRAVVIREYGAVSSVDANDSRLGQVFLNLLVNAAQAIPEGSAGKNEIRILTFERDAKVHVEITDTGTGIPQEKLPMIFEPFFTTKPIGVGTGLGLSICHGIVASFGGEIRVRSAVGQGTTFTVILPAGRLTPKSAPAVTAAGSTAKSRVLVIDDEAGVVRAVKRLLHPHHHVEGTTDPHEALGRLLTGEDFDVILCDMMMPRMIGADLYEQVLRANPRLAKRIVFVTGGGFTPRAREFLSATKNLKLDKPFDAAALHSAIQMVTGESARP